MFQTKSGHEPFYFGITLIVGNSFHGLMDKIGRYQVEHELGRGAMGIVYRAFDPAIGRRIAIKTIRIDELGDEKSRATLRERLLREAQSAGVLSHPNIVTIYDVSEDTRNAYIFMEYVEGATLDSFARGVPVKDLLMILQQTAEALDYAHGRGIVHRDIKPGNLMLSGRQVKVTDFGIARLLHQDSTQSGNLLGTPSYMSPEQVAGSEITGAADQYALGVIAYEFLAGVKPFENENLANLLYKITQAAVPPVATLNAATNQVLARVLSKVPAHRYANCSAFVAALDHALGLEPPKYTPQREVSENEPTITDVPIEAPVVVLPPVNLPPPQKPSIWKPVAGMLLGAGVLIGLLWFSFGRRPAPLVSSSVAPPPAVETKPSAMGEALKPAKVEEKTPEPAVEQSPAPPPQSSGTVSASSHEVSFLSTPAGAEVLVNNGEQDRCPKTPCRLLLPEGEFQVSIRLAGFEEAKRNLRVPVQTQLSVEFEKPQGTVVVNSIPSGATVRIDGRDTRQKTPAMLKLSPGKYTLEVVKEGLPLQTQEITVRNGYIQTLAIQWK